MVPSLINSDISDIYYMVNFWKLGNGLTPEELAEIGLSITGKTDPTEYTPADWLKIRYHLSSLLP
jgi:hypothetical protein